MMNFKRLKRVTGRILDNPKILSARLRGIDWCHAYTCLTAKELMKENAKTIIDIGANKGSFIKASKYVFPNAKIYAFEPQKEYFEIIKNIPNVTAYNSGLWDKERTLEFFKNSKDSGSSSFLKPTELFGNTYTKNENVNLERLNVRRFDRMNIKIERPCFVKIDVEGAEDRVIRGFGNKLHEVDIIQIEWFFRNYHEKQMKLSDVMKTLEKHRFTGFIQREIDYKNGSPSVCDLIFFKEINESRNI